MAESSFRNSPDHYLKQSVICPDVVAAKTPNDY